MKSNKDALNVKKPTGTPTNTKAWSKSQGTNRKGDWKNPNGLKKK